MKQKIFIIKTLKLSKKIKEDTKNGTAAHRLVELILQDMAIL